MAAKGKIALDERVLFWVVTVVQWGTMFVMRFVKFKMFTIIGLFFIPMLLLQALAICLLLLQLGKSSTPPPLLILTHSTTGNINFLSIKKVLNDLSFHCGILVVPQPLYYMTVEFMKLGGKYQSLYYPQPWAILGWLILIIVLYVPFFAQLVLFRRYLQAAASKHDHQDEDKH